MRVVVRLASPIDPVSKLRLDVAIVPLAADRLAPNQLLKGFSAPGGMIDPETNKGKERPVRGDERERVTPAHRGQSPPAKCDRAGESDGGTKNDREGDRQTGKARSTQPR